MKLTKSRSKYVILFQKMDMCKVVSRKQIMEVVKNAGIPFPQWVSEFSAGRGLFDLSFMKELDCGDSQAVVVSPEPKAVEPKAVVVSPEPKAVEPKAVVNDVVSVHFESYIPEKMEGYVPFGNFSDVNRIVKSRIFYPMYITGLSGNGKTLMVEEIAARNGRELIRANITGETDEDDLIGGFRLVGGETVWQDGPVIIAMKRGAILLLDEVDLGTPKLMCLQPVLEGKSVFIKKINQVVRPVEGFNIIATANTKGKGAGAGNFVGAMVMNEAFLERFAITFDQDYPPENTEFKILINEMEKNGAKRDKSFATTLVQWANNVRENYKIGAISEIISTRRLVHIIKAYAIFKNKKKSLTLALARFDEETAKAMYEFYTKFDAQIDNEEVTEVEEQETSETATAAPVTATAAPVTATAAPVTATVAPVDSNTATVATVAADMEEGDESVDASYIKPATEPVAENRFVDAEKALSEVLKEMKKTSGFVPAGFERYLEA